MLNHVVEKTDEFISRRTKEERKKLGQFFTSKSIAQYMASLFDVPKSSSISVLDPGAGSGILSAALVQWVETQYDIVQEINLTCYETNREVLPLLETNMKHLTQTSSLKLHISIIKDNYLLSQSCDFSSKLLASANPLKYDWVICNPPYFKLNKNSPEALSMQSVCHGAPNIYFLFASMGLFNLKQNGEMVYIMPRSWTSGAYFTRFREYFLRYSRLTDIHIFTNRNNVFDKEQVLQETMIVKAKKIDATPVTVKISSSSGSDSFNRTTRIDVPYDVVVSGKQQFVYIPTSKEEIDVLRTINCLEVSLPSIGLKMKTGLTIDYRNRELLRNESDKHVVPLFYPFHLKSGRIIFPAGRNNEYMSDDSPGMLQMNRNYLFVKRFTTIEEYRRLQCAVYLAKYYPAYAKISTENKINFIDTIDNTEIGECLAFGLFTTFNSTIYDKYYRILNGSTQVNSSEINAIPMPDRHVLEQMGKITMNANNFSTEFSDRILKGIINVKN
ncbi:MAG: Eco57I restriction-modification methylase domain-containing protein [Deltaproteobacteria bacterium]|jgi:adenine-specific DNA-methyltransferase|nr:Eco57I restriction-modification methylase domain-containing protein [Deltaproteobacteria bacterium]